MWKKITTKLKKKALTIEYLIIITLRESVAYNKYAGREMFKEKAMTLIVGCFDSEKGGIL